MNISQRKTSSPQSQEQMLQSPICSKAELKILVRYYLMPTKMTTIKRLRRTSVGGDVNNNHINDGEVCTFIMEDSVEALARLI